MSQRKVYFNGSIIPAEEAKIDIADAGFLHGASAFTTMLAHNARVFRLPQHLSRLMETVRLFDLLHDATEHSLTDGVYDLLAANNLSQARMRITLSSGSIHDKRLTTENTESTEKEKEKNLSSFSVSSVAKSFIKSEIGRPTTLITADALPDYPTEWYEKGIAVVVSSFIQHRGDPTCGYKIGCYFPRVLARQEAQKKGAEEALWFTADKQLAEACFCNVFLVLKGVVFTPPRDTPVLPGIVRAAVIEICNQLGIECHDDRPLTVHEMLATEEVFITASCSGIRPVVKIERHGVGNGVPGEITRKIMQAYRQMLETETA